jgi:hypothetical protein
MPIIGLVSYCLANMKLRLIEKLPGDAETHRDYGGRLLFEFMNEIMSEHFRNSCSLSMEGSTAQFFPAEVAQIDREGLQALSQEETETQFHSHSSDGSMQNAATTYFHTEVLILYLRNQAALKERGYMFGNTDGYAKQYRFATALHLLSMLAVKHNITLLPSTELLLLRGMERI